MIKTSFADFSTVNASRYIRRLCKHWSHKFTVSYDDQLGKIDFGDSHCALLAVSDVLKIQITAPVNQLSELQAVVIDHLKRFTAPEEDMNLEWKILDNQM